MTALFLIFLDQICPKWIKLDQIGFLTNQKMLLLKVVTFTKRITMAVLFWIFYGSDLSKVDQTWSNWISQQSKNVTRGRCPKFATRLDIKIGIAQKVYELWNCSFAKILPWWDNHFGKRTVSKLIYFLSYAHFDI